MIIGQSRPNGHYTPCEQCPLRRCDALRAFSPDELAFVKTFKIDELHVAAGASVLREGASSEHLYTVLYGWGFRYKMLDDGRRQILNYSLPGDLIGLQGTVMDEMDHSVEALTELTLCVFSRAKLWDLYGRFPSLGFDLTWLGAREEQLLDESLVSLGRRSSLERTAYLLLHLFTRASDIGLTRENAVHFPFTQQHMADTLGMSLVHTNKTLKRLAATQVVRWKDRWCEILDRERLAVIAGGEPPIHRPRPFI